MLIVIGVDWVALADSGSGAVPKWIAPGRGGVFCSLGLTAIAWIALGGGRQE